MITVPIRHGQIDWRSVGRMSESDVVLFEVSDGIATITLNRPAQRNALSTEMLAALPQRMREADGRDDVDVVILTGADPAFCAGLDLKALGSGGLRPGPVDDDSNDDDDDDPIGSMKPFPSISKPVIGAVNGVAVTGGLELALQCDFLIASEHAKFGDTHARVGVMPGWGLTVLLPQAVGLRRAREMSFTGNFMLADEAFHFGLVNRVVPHDELLPTCRAIAADIIGNDQPGVRQVRATYAEIHASTDGLDIETRISKWWQRDVFSADAVAERRAAIQARGKNQ